MKTLVKIFILSAVATLLAAGCATTKTVSDTPPEDSGIKGRIALEEGGPGKGVYVYAYESMYNDMRVPTKMISPPCGDDGSYTLNLKPGAYYIVARKRTSGDPKGYLVKGDYEGKYPENPVAVKAGQYTPVDIKVAKLSGNFLLAPYLPEGGNMGITGKVYDAEGKPASGAFVLIYPDREMIGLPAYLSKPTDKNGEYSIYLAQPGTYYVAARLKYGGIPKKGEPYGTYDKDTEHRVVVNQKETVTGIDIKLTPFPKDLATPVPSAPVQQ